MLSGGLMALCFPPFGQAGIVWVALVPWLWSLWQEGSGEKSRPFWTSFLGGVVFWIVNLKWLFQVAHLGYVIPCFFLALYFAIFGKFAATLGNPYRVRRSLQATPLAGALHSLRFAGLNALFWCGLEWARGALFPNYGWCGLGASFYENLPLAQGAEFVGVCGLSFLPVLVNCVLVSVALRVAEGVREGGRMKRHWDLVATMSLVILVFAFGVSRIRHYEALPAKVVHVLAVQLDVPQVAGRVMMSGGEIHAALEEETRKGLEAVAAENQRRIKEASEEVEFLEVDWVVWPEVTLYGALLTTPEGEHALMPRSANTIEAMRDAGVDNLIAGVSERDAYEEEGVFRMNLEGKSYNSMLAVDSEGEIHVHRKQELVIYGEYIPFVDQVPLLAKIYHWVAGVEWGGNLGRGEGYEGFSLPASGESVAVIPSICFEDTVGSFLRRFSRSNREVIVNITNDGWFGESEGSRQHFANAIFRCIELRRPMVRAANRGYTGVISATGNPLDGTTGRRQLLEDEEGKPFLRGSVLGRVLVPEAPVTFYARFGDVFSIAGLVLAVAVGLGRLRKSK